MFFDMPYGFGERTGLPWDMERWLREQLDGLVRVGHAINTEKAYTWTFGCHVSQAGMVEDVLADNGFKNIIAIYWHKEGLTHAGSVTWTSSVEVFVQGYHPNVKSSATTFPANPTLRHNHFEGPPLTKYIKHKTGENNGKKVNPHEKPTYVIKHLLQHVLMPGDHVLIVGTGAGGGVRGCIERAGTSLASRALSRTSNSSKPVWPSDRV
jgi:hypothetical protein